MILLAVIATGCKEEVESLPYYNTPDFTPHWISNHEEVSSKITHQISNFSFVNQNGKTITQNDVKGKIHVANFFFTSCPSVCPKMTANFETIQRAFKDHGEVMLLSYSVTPWIDSVARLREYAQDHGVITDKWHLLTGDQKEIYTLARKSYFAEAEPGFRKDSTSFLHTENFILVDGDGYIRGIYKGIVPMDAQRLIDDINILLKTE